MKKTTIYLARHGESLANIDDKISSSIPGQGLSEKGKEQAFQLGNILSLEKSTFNNIYISPTRRTIETFLEIRNKLKKVPVPKIDLRIRELDYGAYDSKTNSEISYELTETMTRIFKGDNEIRLGLYGENEREILTRIYHFFYEVISRNKNKRILVITHAGVISIFNKWFTTNFKKDKKTQHYSVSTGDMLKITVPNNILKKLSLSINNIKKQNYSEYLLENKSGISIAKFYPSVQLPDLETTTPFTFLYMPKSKKWVFSRDKNGWWNPAGGHIEKGETIMDTLKREALEEAGVTIKNIKLIGYAKIERVISFDKKYPTVSIIPFYLSDVEKWEDDWKKQETIERGCFSEKMSETILSKRKDNDQMLQIFKYIKSVIV